MVEVVVSVEDVVVVVGDDVVVEVEIVVSPEDNVVGVAFGAGGVILAGFCAASKAPQSTPISFPSEAAFLYGLLDPKW
jgi:hypothetical protein